MFSKDICFIIAILFCMQTMAGCYTLTSKTSKVCETDACNDAAERLLNSIDFNSEPCNDFYEYACGKFIKSHPLKADENQYGSFTVAEDTVQLRLKNIFETVDPKDIPEVLKAKQYFTTCMTQLDNVKVMSRLIEDLGGWPIASSRHKNFKGPTVGEEYVAKFNKYGISVLLDVTVSTDPYNSTINILQMSKGETVLELDYILNQTEFQPVFNAYRKYITGVVTEMSVAGTVNHTQVAEDVEEMLKFEEGVAKAAKTSEDMLRNASVLYRKMTLKDLQEKTDTNCLMQLDWKKYIYHLSGLKISDDEVVVASDLKYFVALCHLFNSTSKETIANYIVWSLINSIAWTTGGTIEKLRFEFLKVKSGITSEPPRWKQCVQQVESSWGFAIAKPYAEYYFPASSRTEASNVVKDVHDVFLTRLQTVDFMDTSARTAAQEKARNMILLVGYPDWIMNATAQKLNYRDAPVMSGYLLTVSLDLIKTNMKHIFNKLHQIEDRSTFFMVPTTVNAMYESTDNNIVVPAGILQPPFFREGLPKACNYGAIGTVIGHETSHGFDDVGSQFDQNGNLRNWWSASVTEAFQNKTQCFVKQYNNYCPKETQNGTYSICVNGVATLGENIADNSGIEVSYQAYRTWLEKSGEDSHLPNMQNFTNDQLFFLSYANMWCTARNTKNLERSLLFDEHSPARYRVNGVLSNTPEFANAFNCPPGPMNQGANRCTLW